jgi:hypothetical protein
LHLNQLNNIIPHIPKTSSSTRNPNNMRLPTLSLLTTLTTLLTLTHAADPKIPCSRSQNGATFTYTISGLGNNKAGFTQKICDRLKASLKDKGACLTYNKDTCREERSGKYIYWTFDVATICHSGVSLLG